MRKLGTSGMKGMEGDVFACPGCHGGDFADFDHFCDALEIPMDECGPAFAVWMEGRFDVAILRYGPVKSVAVANDKGKVPK